MHLKINIPLTNQVRGPYCNLRTERAINQREKQNEDSLLTVRAKKKKVSKIFIIS